MALPWYTIPQCKFQAQLASHTYSYKEERPDGMERHTLHQSFAASERRLRASLGELVNHHGGVAAVADHRGEVVASAVPCDLLHFL